MPPAAKGQGSVRRARRWGQLSAALGYDSADRLIAATALEHGLTVVSRNLRPRSDLAPEHEQSGHKSGAEAGLGSKVSSELPSPPPPASSIGVLLPTAAVRGICCRFGGKSAAAHGARPCLAPSGGWPSLKAHRRAIPTTTNSSDGSACALALATGLDHPVAGLGR